MSRAGELYNKLSILNRQALLNRVTSLDNSVDKNNLTYQQVYRADREFNRVYQL